MPLKLATHEGFVPILLLVPKDMVPLDGRREAATPVSTPLAQTERQGNVRGVFRGRDIGDGACLPLGAKCALPPRSTPSTVEGAGGAFDPSGRR